MSDEKTPVELWDSIKKDAVDRAKDRVDEGETNPATIAHEIATSDTRLTNYSILRTLLEVNEVKMHRPSQGAIQSADHVMDYVSAAVQDKLNNHVYEQVETYIDHQEKPSGSSLTP